ncbi:MAG: redoxin domain-containing protein, partial [Chitinophagaceae bacterium]
KEEALNKEVNSYRKKLILEHPQSLLATIFQAMEEPKVPPAPRIADGHQDSTFAFRYYQQHFWDHINFSDSAILRTPIFQDRLHKYFTELVPPIPDSLNKEADQLLNLARANREMFKFTLWWLTFHFESSPYMGMDEVFVHLVEKYYVPGDAYWLSQKQNDDIIQRAYSLAPNLIGQTAPNLALEDSTLRHPFSLDDIQAKYLLVVFWDPTCGHCQVELPVMDSAYRADWKNLGVKILGIRTGGTKEQWEDFIRDHHLDGWIHGWDPEHKSNYHHLYDVYETPVVYLLDEHKKIIAKKLGVKELSTFLHQETQKKSPKRS